jgi:hypothetical protein
VGFNKNQKPLRNFLFVRAKNATLAFDQHPSIAVRYDDQVMIERTGPPMPRFGRCKVKQCRGGSIRLARFTDIWIENRKAADHRAPDRRGLPLLIAATRTSATAN